MMHQRLSPGMQDGKYADLGAEPARIGRERRHRLGGGLEQDRIDDGLVLEGDRGDRRRQRKDDVEIGNRQQVGFSRGEPRGSGFPLTLRTVTVSGGSIVEVGRGGSHNPQSRRPVIQMASPPATGGRAGSASPGSYGWRPACSAPSTTNYCARERPG